MREKLTEQKLVRAVKTAGGIAVKFVSPGFDGMPDRLVLLPVKPLFFLDWKHHFKLEWAPFSKRKPLCIMNIRGVLTALK